MINNVVAPFRENKKQKEAFCGKGEGNISEGRETASEMVMSGIIAF